jgi:hypothetical protein
MRTLRRMLKLASLPPAVVLAATLVAAGCQLGATTSVATATAIPIATPTSTLPTALSGTFSPTGSMTSPRLGHTATPLPSGKVLIAGGGTDTKTGGDVSTADLYEPATSAFSSTGAMSTIRSGATATLLADGRVLIAGGVEPRSYSNWISFATAELYTP